MKVRIRDIALRAGVSPATVSNALNGRTGVSEEIAASIRQLADSMGYVGGKAVAKPAHEIDHVRLVMVKRHGLVVMNTQFFMELVESIERECQVRGLDLAISHVHIGEDEDFRGRIRTICAEKCAGVIVLATEMEAADLALFDGCASPMIALDNLFRHERVSSVVMNNYDAGFQATNALYDAGHRQIGHVTSTVEFNNMRYRRKGYEAAMDWHGLRNEESSIWRVIPTLDGTYRDMLELLKGGRKPPTAFFAGNDIIAVGCMRALLEMGYAIPQDISIIGMDDMQICEFSSPPLSTIRVFRKDMGTIAVSALLDIVPKLTDGCVSKTELGVELVQRLSVAAPHAQSCNAKAL